MIEHCSDMSFRCVQYKKIFLAFLDVPQTIHTIKGLQRPKSLLFFPPGYPSPAVMDGSETNRLHIEDVALRNKGKITCC